MPDSFAGKALQSTKASGIRHVELNFTMIGAGAAAPTLGEGEVPLGSNASQGIYVLLGRTGVGVYTITTVQTSLAIVGCSLQPLLGTPAGQINAYPTFPFTQNANKTWTITVSVFNGAAALELASTNALYVSLRFREGIQRP